MAPMETGILRDFGRAGLAALMGEWAGNTKKVEQGPQINGARVPIEFLSLRPNPAHRAPRNAPRNRASTSLAASIAPSAAIISPIVVPATVERCDRRTLTRSSAGGAPPGGRGPRAGLHVVPNLFPLDGQRR